MSDYLDDETLEALGVSIDRSMSIADIISSGYEGLASYRDK
jgi:uncharacterized protein YaeQ